MNVGDGIRLTGNSWDFDEAAANFDQHVIRSVPQLAEQREFVARLARFFLHQDARVYELLGVSAGRLAEAVLRHGADRKISYTGLDISTAMVRQARTNLASDSRFTAEAAGILGYRFEPAALVLYEKTLAAHPLLQDMLGQLYAGFKLEQGFSPDEILNKSKSLQGVADPRSSDWNKALWIRDCREYLLQPLF